MKKIDGTATISIETLDELREREQWYNSLRETLIVVCVRVFEQSHI